jgi:hypothetical protein
MEVAPQELAQLLKLAGVGAGPEPDIMSEPEVMSEPDMPGSEIEPEISVMAIPSDDGAPVGGGCGAPEPEHDHEHDPGGEMRGIIDMLQGGGEEPIEESPPKDDYENASNEFTGHPVDVVDTYDQYSYEPAKNSGMQRRTNSYGDNPLREEDLIKEYTEFKKFPLFEVNWSNQAEVEAEYKRLGLDQGDDPLGGWWDTRGMSDMEIRHKRTKRIKQAYKDRPIDRQQDTRIADKGITGEEEGQAVALLGKDALDDPNWRDNVAAKKQADKEASVANIAAQKAERNRQAEIDRQKEGETDAIAQLQDRDSDASKVRQQAAADRLARDPRTVANLPVTGDGTAVASAKAVQQSTDSLPPRTQQQIANQARIDGDNSQLATPPKDEIKGWKSVADFKARKNAPTNIAGTGATVPAEPAGSASTEPSSYEARRTSLQNPTPQATVPTPDLTGVDHGLRKAVQNPTSQANVTTSTPRGVLTPTASAENIPVVSKPRPPKAGQNDNLKDMYRKSAERAKAKKAKSAVQPQVSTGGGQGDPEVAKLYAGKYSDGLDRLKLLAGI